jgi:DNA-binding transcriptional LysR family regulator
MRYSWDLIRSFHAVAETGSLSAASRLQGLTQPTVGRHIDLLEAELKVPLFTRSRDGMALTPKGEDLFAAAQEVGETATAFERRAAGLDEGVAGTVRISANDIFGVLILPGLIGEFIAANPSVDVELVVSNDASNLSKRDADVAIRMFRPTQNDLVARKITELPLGLFSHRSYLADRPDPVSFDDLRNFVLVGYDRDPSLIEAIRLMGAEFTPSDFKIRTDNILSHIWAIRSGAGIGITHLGLAQRWDGVDRVLPELTLPSLDLWLACHADVRYNKRVRAVMDFLADRLKDPYASCDI